MGGDGTCPLCGGCDTRALFAGNRLPVRRCSCGMMFLFPHPSAGELSAIYGADYFERIGVLEGEEGAAKEMKQRTFRVQFAEATEGMIPGRVLDIGCASGYFMEVAEAAGWEAHGVELSDAAARVAARRFGARVRQGTLQDASFAEVFFDVVTLFDVLEHLPDPGIFLEEVRRVLRPGGRVLLVMPNAASVSAKIMGRHWSHYNAEHLLYFTPETVRRLLEGRGFTVEKVADAPKFLTPAYIFGQLRRYPRLGLPLLCKVADLFLPTAAKRRELQLHCGEMLVVATAPAGAPHAAATTTDREGTI